MSARMMIVGVLLLLASATCSYALPSRVGENGDNDAPSRITARVSQGTDSRDDSTRAAVYPLSVKRESTLPELSVSRIAVEKQQAEERATYERVQQEAISPFSPDRETTAAQLVEQRRRFWVSTLNVMIVLYQRMDLILDKLDNALVKLRSYADDTPNPAQFEEDISFLESELARLHAQSDAVSRHLEEVTARVELGPELPALKQELNTLLSSLRSFFGSYVRVVQQVIAARA